MSFELSTIDNDNNNNTQVYYNAFHALNIVTTYGCLNIKLQITFLRATNDDGRCPGLITREAFIPGVYKMRFETGQYWNGLGEACFYPYVEVRLQIFVVVVV